MSGNLAAQSWRFSGIRIPALYLPTNAQMGNAQRPTVRYRAQLSLSGRTLGQLIRTWRLHGRGLRAKLPADQLSQCEHDRRTRPAMVCAGFFGLSREWTLR